MKDTINHSGVIERIDGHVVYVKITQQSACSGCHARSICMSTDNKDKIIEVIDNSGSFQANEPVVVCGQTSMGLQAVLLAFVFPLFMIVTGIASGTVLGWDESLSAFTGLAILAPYYGILYILRKKLEKRFIFTLEKQKTNSSIA